MPFLIKILLIILLGSSGLLLFVRSIIRSAKSQGIINKLKTNPEFYKKLIDELDYLYERKPAFPVNIFMLENIRLPESNERFQILFHEIYERKYLVLVVKFDFLIYDPINERDNKFEYYKSFTVKYEEDNSVLSIWGETYENLDEKLLFSSFSRELLNILEAQV